MKDESKKVYILLSKTKTVPSNLIKLMTREPYLSHISGTGHKS